MSAERGLRNMISARPSSLPTVLAVVVVLLLVALGTLAARSDAWVPPGSARDPAAVSSPSAAPTTAPASLPPVPPAPPVDAVSNGWLVLVVLVAVVLLLLLLIGLVALAVATGRISWRRRVPGERAAGLGQEPGAANPSDPLSPAVQRALTEVIDQPDAREAVVRAWLLLGEAAAAAGTARRPAETAGEYAERLAAAHDLPRTSVERLATLYREARFSHHTVVAEQRDAARTELLALQAALAVHAPDALSTRPPV
jgi:hypothetical protein